MAEKKLQRVEGKIIKHAPSRRFKHSDLDTVIHVHNSTPFISGVKRIDKTLKQLGKKQPKAGYITVRGMGASIPKVVSLGLHFQKLGERIEVETKSVEVLDEFEQEDDDSVLRKRKVSSVEVRIYKSVSTQ